MNDIAPVALSNNPPLAELLTEETAPYRERRDALIASVNSSHITDADTAAQVTTLGGMLKDLRDRVEAVRKERARPFDDGKAAVQRAFAQDIIKPLDDAMTACRRMIDTWRAKLAEDAAAERRQREAEAAEARRQAEEAEARRREAEKQNDPQAALKAELEEVQARDRAEALAGGEGVIRPAEMIRTQAGAAVTTATRVPTVTDIGLVLRWLIQHQSTALLEAITPLIARLARAKVEIPGVTVAEVAQTRFRR